MRLMRLGGIRQKRPQDYFEVYISFVLLLTWFKFKHSLNVGWDCGRQPQREVPHDVQIRQPSW